MAIALGKVWKLLNTDIELISGEAVEGGAEASKLAIELAVALGWLATTPVNPAGAAIALSHRGMCLRDRRTLRTERGAFRTG